MFETRDGFTTAQESECEWGRKRLLKKVIEDHVEKMKDTSTNELKKLKRSAFFLQWEREAQKNSNYDNDYSTGYKMNFANQ